MRNLLNFVAFQAVWCACVFGAANGAPLWGLAVFAVSAALHLAFDPHPAAEAKLMAAAAVGGGAIEWILWQTGAIDFPARARTGGSVPLWMPALWANFASTLHYSLAWLKGRWAAAVVLGAVAGPLSYVAGERIGAILLPQDSTSYAAVAFEWALATPALLWFADRSRA